MMRRLLFLLLIGLLLLVGMLTARPAFAQARVDIPAGQPWQPIIDKSPAGSTFLIKAGVHRMQTVRPRTGDTFLGETRGGILVAIVSGARVLDGWSRAGNVWWVAGQTQQGKVHPSTDACWSTHPRCVYPEDVFFDNVWKKHVQTRAEVGPGSWFFDYAADRIYVGDDPAGHVVETSVVPYLVAFGSAASNVTFDSLIIEKYATPTAEGAVNLGDSPRGGRDWVLQNSEVRWNHGGGVWNDTNTTTRRNRIHSNCGFGLLGAGTDIRVEDNEVAYNNIAAGATITSWSNTGSNATCGNNSYWGAGGSKWVYTTRLIVRGNRSHHNDGPGLWTDINNVYTLYENNVVFENARGGIFHEISYDAVIRHNTLKRNGLSRDYPWWTTGAGIEVVGSPNVEVYGNLVEDNFQAITGLSDHRGSGVLGPWDLANLLVYDNDVRYSMPPPAGFGRHGIIDTQGLTAFQSAANNRFENNRYANEGEFIWHNASVSAATWRAHGQDIESVTGGVPSVGTQRLRTGALVFAVLVLLLLLLFLVLTRRLKLPGVMF